jgi:aspartate/methionine/tyrosine aminotransferase
LTGSAELSGAAELGWSVPPELGELHNFNQLEADYAGWQSRGLKLDLQRGKPSPAQLDLSEELLADPGIGHHVSAEGFDIRNYGGPDGLLELRSIFAELLNIPVAQFLALANGSLRLMHDTAMFALLFGVPGSQRPWIADIYDGKPVKFICPVPGYDRHFSICAELGIEMIPVPMLDDGPDVCLIASLVAKDSSIKGMWIVPTYSNPTGATLSEEKARALFSMPTAAPDFRIFWDDAYGIHHLTDDCVPARPVLSFAAEAGNPDRVFVFTSTSKITFAGSGVAFFAASPTNLAWLRSRVAVQSIGPDKVNQYRHAMYLKSPDNVRALMGKHRAILLPKFVALDAALRAGLRGSHGSPAVAGSPTVARWNMPKGGYFISLDVLPGTAKRVVELAAGAGLALTPAGSAFPHEHDPNDSNIRLAPSMLAVADVELAGSILASCILLAAAETVHPHPSPAPAPTNLPCSCVAGQSAQGGPLGQHPPLA